LGSFCFKDIDNIASYIGRDSIMAAREQVKRFFQRTEILIDYPLVGNIVPELNNENTGNCFVDGTELFIEQIMRRKFIFCPFIIKQGCWKTIQHLKEN